MITSSLTERLQSRKKQVFSIAELGILVKDYGLSTT